MSNPAREWVACGIPGGIALTQWKLAALALVAGTCSPHAWAAPKGSTGTTLERGVLEEINFARMHPRDYAAQLREYRTWFDGDVVREPDDPVGHYTQEGIAAVDEAIVFLERQQPLPPLAAGQVLALAAQDYADEQGPAGRLGHVSRAGLSPGERVKRRGGDVYVGETISYGYSTPADVVRQFIIDDGERRRGHRALIFSRSYRFAGVGCGRHATYGYMCVVDYAGTPDGNPMLPTQTAGR